MIRKYYLSIIHGERKGFLSLVLKILLRILGVIYGGLVRCHGSLYGSGLFRPKKLSVPVISIGNITWGGTGKTPLVIEMAKIVQRLGKKPAVLIRGYGSDEWKEITANLPGVPVGVGRNRIQSGCDILSKEKVDVMICDDAFQHRPLARNWEIVVINAANAFGNGHLIPAGELREPLSSLCRAQTVVLTHVDRVSAAQLAALKEKLLHSAPQAEWVEAAHEPVHFYEAVSGEIRGIQAFRGKRAAAFCAVGSPRLFVETLERLGVEIVESFEFQDHHLFTAKDVEKIRDSAVRAGLEAVITTEKDLFRAPGLLKEMLRPWVLKVRMKIISGEEKITGRLSALLQGPVLREKVYA